VSLFFIIQKELQRMVSDRKALVINLSLPLLLTFIMGLSFGGGVMGGSGISAIKLLFVGEDLPEPLQTRLAQGLDESGFFKVDWTDSLTADAMVRSGEVVAAIYFPPDFMGEFFQEEELSIEIWKDPASPLKAGIVEQMLERPMSRYQAGEAAFRSLWPDSEDAWDEDSEKSINEFFSGDFNDIWQRFRHRGNDQQWDRVVEQMALTMDRQVLLSDAMQVEVISLKIQDKEAEEGEAKSTRNLYNYFMPGFAVFFLMFAAAASARDLLRERKQGTLQRQLVSPVSQQMILLGKWVAATVQGTAMLMVLFLLGAILFNVNLGPDPFTLMMGIFLTSSAAAGIFLFMALASPTEKIMDNISPIFILVSAMLGGNMVPLDSMPAWAQSAGQFVFNYWANLILNNTVARDMGLYDQVQPVVILSSISMVFLLLSFILMGIKSRKGGLV
jgi:ABC-2 type transport system permease protein